jgi:hypothetical protein
MPQEEALMSIKLIQPTQKAARLISGVGHVEGSPGFLLPIFGQEVLLLTGLGATRIVYVYGGAKCRRN